MAICASTCGVDLPTSYTGGCGIVSRPGGIKRLWFAKCNAPAWDYADDGEWTTAQNNGDVVGSGLIMGQKPKGSFTKKRIASCVPEGITGAEKQITFQDYNSDTVTTVGDPCALHNFWARILTFTSDFKLFYETCEGTVYGPINDFIIEVDEVIEDNNTGSSYFDGTIMWNSITDLCPKFVIGGNGITPA